jgi:hypothetical protein
MFLLANLSRNRKGLIYSQKASTYPTYLQKIFEIDREF